jgi:hypothetical protein
MQLIPENYQFDANSNPPAYVEQMVEVSDQAEEKTYGTESGRIEKGESVKIRIVGTRVDATEIVTIRSHIVCHRHNQGRLFRTWSIKCIIHIHLFN